jgi:hypothetical protein
MSNTPSKDLKTIGIIAGYGELPRAIASEVKNMGYRITAVALEQLADRSLQEYADDFHCVPIGRFGKIIRILKKSSVTETVIAGKVPKGILYRDKRSLMPDMRAVKFLLSLKDYSDSTILEAIRNELKKEGIAVLDTRKFTKNLLTPLGVISKKKPNKKHASDIEFGWRIAKEIGNLDIGQTIVVKDRAVMAVEAIEGTDEAILRGGSLAGSGAVVIKVSKPQQDMNLDVPVVGMNTLSAMKKTGAALLALEAGKSIILERERFTKEADKSGIIVVGTKDGRF